MFDALLIVLAAAAIVAIAWLMGRYRRVYRDPIVLETERDAKKLARIRLADIPEADRVLDRAQTLSSTLTMNVISPEQWQRAKRAALSPESAIEEFCHTLGARLLEPIHDAPDGTPARDVTLPSFNLRFVHATSVCAITGTSLRHGDAVALAMAVHRKGRGPREAIALDLSTQQDARTSLADIPQVAFLVIGAEELRDLFFSMTPDLDFERILVAQRAIADLSPYQTQGAVTQDAFFFGRERELRSMADQAMTSFLLVGARQMGKSTLLRALHRRLQARDDVDARYVELASGDLLAHLEHGRVEAPAMDEDPYRRLVRCATSGGQRPCVWLLDETDDFVRTDAATDYALTRAMRKLSSERRAHFVLAGYWDLYAAKYLEPDHPLRNLGELVELGPLDRHAASRLATEPMYALGISWHADAKARVIDGTGRRANLIVLVCKALIESLPANEREITLEHVDAVLLGAPRIRELTHACRALRDELRLPRRKPYTDLDRAIVYQTLLLERDHGEGGVTVRGVRSALAAQGVSFTGVMFEDALGRLELGHILLVHDGRLSCPVPWIREVLERRGLEELLRDHLDDFGES